MEDSEVLKALEGEGWCDIAPPTPEELQEEPSLLGFLIVGEQELSIRGGICVSQEASEEDKCEDMVSYQEYSTGDYTVSHREVERTVTIDGEEITKPLPQVRVEEDE